jgi:hypothetical protein
MPPTPNSTRKPVYAACPKAGRQQQTIAKKLFITLCSTENCLTEPASPVNETGFLRNAEVMHRHTPVPNPLPASL